jgi:hypothetical protein
LGGLAMLPRVVRQILNNPARILAAAAAALVVAACSDTTTNTQSPEVSAAISNYTAAQFGATAKPKFTTVGSASAFTSNTIPYWSSSFTDPTNGVTRFDAMSWASDWSEVRSVGPLAHASHTVEKRTAQDECGCP